MPRKPRVATLPRAENPVRVSDNEKPPQASNAAAHPPPRRPARSSEESRPSPRTWARIRRSSRLFKEERGRAKRKREAAARHALKGPCVFCSETESRKWLHSGTSWQCESCYHRRKRRGGPGGEHLPCK